MMLYRPRLDPVPDDEPLAPRPPRGRLLWQVLLAAAFAVVLAMLFHRGGGGLR